MRKPDPENLRVSESPAIVDVDGQGPVFVADASTRENGWLRIREWNGTSAKLPSQRVRQVRYLGVESYGEPDSGGMKPKRLANEEWRARAHEWTTSENGETPVVADD